ncbi:hypothetical protein RPC_3526 [Rhodopseudomonas palustris BisB18]|uniref:Short-chain dehydrogenase/reductase SDR n=1 Tax=Rhodopseudomonas palustris (strain BisB18) TaxID=316056 RepID=Q210X1_RHOPB
MPPEMAEHGLRVFKHSLLSLPLGRLAGIPLRRFGKPEELADAILFVASDEANCEAALPLDHDEHSGGAATELQWGPNVRVQPWLPMLPC